MSINGDWCLLLLSAAEFVEKKNRDHDYASSVDVHTNHNRSKRSTTKTVTKFDLNRNLHNELEKSRRANMRHRFEKLKQVVPIGVNSSKHTTLGILIKSAHFIKTLESTNIRQNQEMATLKQDKVYLLQKLYQLTNDKYRELVDSSPLTTISTSSNEQEEIDIEYLDVEEEGNSNGSSEYENQSSNNSSDLDIWQSVNHISNI